MPGNKTEYEVESLFIDRLQSIGYEFVQLKMFVQGGTYYAKTEERRKIHQYLHAALSG